MKCCCLFAAMSTSVSNVCQLWARSFLHRPLLLGPAAGLSLTVLLCVCYPGWPTKVGKACVLLVACPKIGSDAGMLKELWTKAEGPADATKWGCPSSDALRPPLWWSPETMGPAFHIQKPSLFTLHCHVLFKRFCFLIYFLKSNLSYEAKKRAVLEELENHDMHNEMVCAKSL